MVWTRPLRIRARLLPTVAAATVLVVTSVPVLATTLGVAIIPAAFTQGLRAGIAEYASSRGVSVQFTQAPDGAVEEQVDQIRHLIAAKVDGLLVLPVEASVTARIDRLAQEADIPLVYLNYAPDEDRLAGRVAFVLPNDLVAGRLQMRKLAQMLNGAGRIALISGKPDHAGAALRVQGVREVMAEFPDLQTVAEGTADWNRAKARALVAGWLARNIAIDAIAAANDEMALGAAEAVEAAGLPAGRILIGGVDATADGIAAMQSKRLAVTIYNDAAQQGRRAIENALALMRREPVPRYDWMPFELVTDRMSTTHFAK